MCISTGSECRVATTSYPCNIHAGFTCVDAQVMNLVGNDPGEGLGEIDYQRESCM